MTSGPSSILVLLRPQALWPAGALHADDQINSQESQHDNPLSLHTELHPGQVGRWQQSLRSPLGRWVSRSLKDYDADAYLPPSGKKGAEALVPHAARSWPKGNGPEGPRKEHPVLEALLITERGRLTESLLVLLR